jgi:hypothetical protein
MNLVAILPVLNLPAEPGVYDRGVAVYRYLELESRATSPPRAGGS